MVPLTMGARLLLATAGAAISTQAPAQAIVGDPGAAPSNPDSIVVTGTRATTATKTDTPIVDVPQSIDIVSADQIAARGAIGVQEALRYAPGVRTEPNGADFRFDYVISRGFNAAQYVDGLQRPDSSFTTRSEVYNLDRIEVLLGPSSVLYGQGTAGGIVNSITKRPQFETHGEIAAEYGSFDRKQIEGDLTGALDKNGTIAGRLVAVFRDADTQTDFGRDARVFVAPSLRFKPDDRTDIVAQGLYERDRLASIYTYQPVAASLLAPPGGRLRRGAYLGEPSLNFYDTRQASATLLATHRFSDALTYYGAVRYTRSSAKNGDIEADVFSGSIDPFVDGDGRTIGRSRYDQRGHAHTLTTDNNLRLDVKTGPLSHKLLVGVDYLRSRIVSRTSSVEASPIDIYDPAYDAATVPPADYLPDPRAINSQLGFYAQDQIDVRAFATVLAGVRRDRAVSDIEDDGRQVDHATSFRAGLVLHPVRGLSPYFSYSESFLPTIGRDFYGRRFVPQRGTQYETGIKWQPDARTLLTAAAFRIRGSNLVQTDPMNGNNQIQIGVVRSRGIELSAARTIARDYMLTASYSYLHARTGRSEDSLGERLPISGIPANQASISGEKRFRLGGDVVLRLGGGVRYVGPSRETDRFEDTLPDDTVIASLATLRTPGFTLADALAGAEWRHWTLTVNATNLFDKHYYGLCSPRTACGPGYRRNVIGTLGYVF